MCPYTVARPEVYNFYLSVVHFPGDADIFLTFLQIIIIF